LHCHAGCTLESITSALELKPRDLFPPKVRAKRRGKIVATYDYCGADGKLLFQAVRFEPKDFSQRRPDGNCGWIWNLKDVPRVLYRLPQLIVADPNQTVCIAEGEKDVDRLVALGFIATTCPLGANKWDKLQSDSVLEGRCIAIFPDADEPGRAHAHAVANRLHGRAAEVRIVAVPDGAKDISAWIETQANRTAIELREFLEAQINATPLFEPPAATTEPSSNSDEPNTESSELIALGQRDPATGRLVLSPKKTLPTAEVFVREFFQCVDDKTLVSYAGQFFWWLRNRYTELEDGILRQKLQPWLHAALRYFQAAGNRQPVLVPFDSNPTTVNAALDTLRSYTHLAANVTPPAWLGDDQPSCDPRDILCCRSINLHLPTGTRLKTTPRLFAVNALTFDHDPSAAVPDPWLTFLEQLWGDDREQIELLQEWTGYCLTGDTRQQKMVLLVGPRRSGKGTIARVLAQLVGSANICGPTVSSLAGEFGLQPLLGKSLAIVSDARFSGRDLPIVVERLLCISGEDAVSVNRKFLTAVTMKLPTRFMFLTNELPRLIDASSALAGRFLILRLSESFYGREDVDLSHKLLQYLPGILNWAIAGWRRLNDRGRFVQPASTSDAVREMEELASPVLAFVRDQCVVGPDERASLDDLYRAWKTWCEDEGRESPGPKILFGRNLLAAMPHVRSRRGTDDGRFYEGIGLVPPNL